MQDTNKTRETKHKKNLLIEIMKKQGYNGSALRSEVILADYLEIKKKGLWNLL